MKIICQNKKASHDYFLLDTYEAGIKLKGTEIKSIRGIGYTIGASKWLERRKLNLLR